MEGKCLRWANFLSSPQNTYKSKRRQRQPMRGCCHRTTSCDAMIMCIHTQTDTHTHTNTHTQAHTHTNTWTDLDNVERLCSHWIREVSTWRTDSTDNGDTPLALRVTLTDHATRALIEGGQSGSEISRKSILLMRKQHPPVPNNWWRGREKEKRRKT